MQAQRPPLAPPHGGNDYSAYNYQNVSRFQPPVSFGGPSMRSASVSALNFVPPEQTQIGRPTSFYASQTQQQQQQQQHFASSMHLNVGNEEPDHAVVPQALRNQQFQTDKNQPLMRGWLHHWDGWPIKFWHKRWAVLRTGSLNIYKSSTSDKLLNSFLLHNYQITVSGREDKNYRRFAFRCEAPGLKTLYFATEAENDMKEWIEKLRNAVQPAASNYSEAQRKQAEATDTSDYQQRYVIFMLSDSCCYYCFSP